MELLVYLHDLETGRKAIYPDTWSENLDGLNFMWGDGNYVCDCNRALFMIRELEHREPEDWETPCGRSRYWVEKIVDAETGEAVYVEPQIEYPNCMRCA